MTDDYAVSFAADREREQATNHRTEQLNPDAESESLLAMLTEQHPSEKDAFGQQ
ncbi:Hypothetical predicted protein [Podarcis lilfordi]|uniref:Uncharacterized protein n=1 Tax=Podarcis lilfordi TaxID=74358 RepID=A0AA35LDA1_9SAUR|nr:Hypothetical predicted protein [Podarcis lilfordi]